MGWDSDRNGCGYSEATKDYPYLYWPAYPDLDLLKRINAGDYSDVTSLLNNGICVKRCPTSNIKDPVMCVTTSNFEVDYKFHRCQYYPGAYFDTTG
jgi:hypothetical protein